MLFKGKMKISDYAATDSVGPDPLRNNPAETVSRINADMNQQAKEKSKLKQDYIPGQNSLEGPQKEKKKISLDKEVLQTYNN